MPAYGHKRGTEVWGKSSLIEATHTVAIDKARMRQLLQLCHPDKHNGSATSTAVFQWLMSLRKELDK